MIKSVLVPNIFLHPFGKKRGEKAAMRFSMPITTDILLFMLHLMELKKGLGYW